MKIKVKEYFQDKMTGRYYAPGEVLDIENENRAKDIVDRELGESVEVEEEKKEEEEEEKTLSTLSIFDQDFEKKAVVDALKSIGEKATMNMKDKTILSNIAALDEEKTVKLKETLNIE